MLLSKSDNCVIQFFKRERKVVDILLGVRNLHTAFIIAAKKKMRFNKT